MPVRLIERSDAGWQERCVAESGDEFRFVLEPITDAELRAASRDDSA